MTQSATPARGVRPGDGITGTPTSPSTPARSGGAGTLRRIKDRRKAGPTYKAAMAVFTVGLLAICVDAVLFLCGVRDMPLWLHLLTILAPLGLAVGLVGTVLEARRERD